VWPFVLPELARRVPRRARILDAGCGNGALVRELAARGYESSGLDISESCCRIAREQCPARIEAASVYDDVRQLFGIAFDAVTALEVVEHLYDPPAFARRMHDALSPTGILVLSAPYHGYLKNLALAASGRLEKHFTANAVGGHIKFWSRRTLTDMLEQNGFRVQRFQGCGRVPYLWKAMVLVAERSVEGGDGRAACAL
jgi:2-polyprenyl-6-hydroxyphenyl methylase/3-demethylubiquinone-9 3-methyltransferase